MSANAQTPDKLNTTTPVILDLFQDLRTQCGPKGAHR
jgi:hypothetical protein